MDRRGPRRRTEVRSSANPHRVPIGFAAAAAGARGYVRGCVTLGAVPARESDAVVNGSDDHHRQLYRAASRQLMYSRGTVVTEVTSRRRRRAGFEHLLTPGAGVHEKGVQQRLEAV